MTNQRPTAEDIIIDWRFSVGSELGVVRYGKAGPYFYKQFMPGGIQLPDRHPVKRIDERTYLLAERTHAQGSNDGPTS